MFLSGKSECNAQFSRKHLDGLMNLSDRVELFLMGHSFILLNVCPWRDLILEGGDVLDGIRPF